MSKISVIIPAYNCAKTIKETIESVLTQSFTDFELIVINDGSTDSSLDIVSKIKDSRIKTFSYTNVGGNVSRNRGINHAVGEFISFLDADDIWTPDKLATQLQALEENPLTKVAYSWTDYIDENGNFVHSGTHISLNGNVYEQLLVKNFLENGSNPLISKDALLAVGGFDESLLAGQDWDMWLRLAREFNFVAVPEVQILYRISANSLSCNLARQEKACLQVLNKAYSTSPESLQHLKAYSFANLYKYLTWKALQNPLNRQKGLAGALFLWKYVKNDSSRLQNRSLTLILFFKIVVILMLPSALSTALLTSMKIFANKVKNT
ncbi:glycosyltransferase [Scytonema hofmannii FACHB-248]|uniref:Glycosyltransferase n=1 Tax=Scytonema hofmannii FACHB-248 TaxID=1842502 RepID=A0ABR8H088_9CYAN|nr:MULTISPECIES: glycosyltransferase [Nostocales]MBD2608757.1 glycosyltransferase [Scytonema hofmannii FACHB-248]